MSTVIGSTPVKLPTNSSRASPAPPPPSVLVGEGWVGAQLPRPPHPKRVFLSLLHVCFAFSSFYLPVLPGGGGAAARARDGTPSRALGSGPAPSPGGGGAQINALTGQHRCWWGLWSLAAMGWVPPLHPFCAAVGAPIPASRNSLRAFTSPPSPLLSRCPPPRLALLSPLLSSRPHPVPCLSHLTSMPQRPTAPPPPYPPPFPGPAEAVGLRVGFIVPRWLHMCGAAAGPGQDPPAQGSLLRGPPTGPFPAAPGAR